MICHNCKNEEYEDTVTQHRMECQNRLFNFENVPAKKCPKCGHVFIEESVVRTLLFRTQRINQFPGIAYHKAKWGPELEEEALQAQEKSTESCSVDDQKKALKYVQKNKKRIQDQKTTKKNILKLFKWTFDQETGVKKDQIVNDILAKIRGSQAGVFAFSCKSTPNTPYETLDYLLLVTEDDAWFHAQHDTTLPIYHLI
ncbi:YgiT-type zinc finger protein [Desulfoplanes sp.]